MPGSNSFTTNMRIRFPVLAILLQVIIIILFGIFVRYQPTDRWTQPSANMGLYPSKWCHWLINYSSLVKVSCFLGCSNTVHNLIRSFLHFHLLCTLYIIYWRHRSHSKAEVSFWGKHIILNKGHSAKITLNANMKYSNGENLGTDVTVLLIWLAN